MDDLTFTKIIMLRAVKLRRTKPLLARLGLFRLFMSIIISKTVIIYVFDNSIFICLLTYIICYP